MTVGERVDCGRQLHRVADAARIRGDLSVAGIRPLDLAEFGRRYPARRWRRYGGQLAILRRELESG